MAVGTPPRTVMPAVAVGTKPVALRDHFATEYWAGLRFLVFGRAVPGVLFGLMGWLQLSRVLTTIATAQAGSSLGSIAGRVVSPTLYTMFCAIPAVLYL